MIRLTLKRRIVLVYTLLSIILLAILLPIVYGTVSASLSLDIQSQLSSAIAEVIISADDRDERFVLNDQVVLPDYLSMCIVDARGETLFATANGEWLRDVSVEGVGKTAYRNDTYTVLTEQLKIEEMTVTASAAIPSGYAERSLNTLRMLLCILAPIYFLLSVAGAYLLSKRAIRPITEITHAAEAISAGDLSRRITGISTRDEVQELADTFNTMLNRLQESFARERQFTSDASHELRTPIAVISACAEELKEHNADGEDAQNLSAIQRESDRMNRIISQMLTLTRGYEGRCHIKKEALELDPLVGSVLDELAESAAAAQIRLFNKVPDGSMLYADQSLMTQLLINLIGNSIKYGVPGGKVIVRASVSDEQCILTISDDGIGIQKDDLSHIFERFYRADKARDRSGSGLGLSIVKWIVELHEGQISVSSEYGKGTQFDIRFPNHPGNSNSCQI